jgi:hypothetical protein
MLDMSAAEQCHQHHFELLCSLVKTLVNKQQGVHLVRYLVRCRASNLDALHNHADTITAANEAHVAKEKALSEVAALKLAAEKEHAAFEEEWRQLSHIIEDDRCAACQSFVACQSYDSRHKHLQQRTIVGHLQDSCIHGSNFWCSAMLPVTLQQPR